MKKIIIVFLIFPIVLAAQINESDTLKVKADLTLSGFWQGGNVETVIFKAKSEVSLRPAEKWAFKTINSYVYQEFGREKADEDILSLNFIYFNPEQKVSPLLLGFFSTNYRREIKARQLFGAGISFQLLTHEDYWLKFAVSSEYEHTDFNLSRFNLPEYNGQNVINTFRGTIWVKGEYHLFKRKVVLSHESYFQPSLQKADNYRWEADLSLDLPLTKHFSFKINYVHSFESIVIESQKLEDNMLTFGFTLKSY